MVPYILVGMFAAFETEKLRRAILSGAGALVGCRFSSISIVAAFQAKFIFNVYSDFAVINYSPLKIRCFFGFTGMPRTRRRRILPVLRSEDPSQL